MNIVFFNDPEKLQKLCLLLLEGMGTTINIFFMTLVLSIPLGMLVSQGRMSRHRLISKPLSFYIYIMRSTPLMLQLLFIYFFAQLVLPFKADRLAIVVFAFAINYAAYFAEIFRSGILGIPAGQREAGKVLGYTSAQIFFRITLPQVAKRVLLPVTNEIITLVKDTALASTVAIMEVLSMAKKQVASSSSLEPFIIAIICYLIFNGLVEQLCKLVERKLDYYK